MAASTLEFDVCPQVAEEHVVSHDGLQILESVGQAPRFNRWLMDGLQPYLGTRILEAGSGIGNLTELLSGCERLVGVDMDAAYVDRLRRRYASQPSYAFYQTDLHDLIDMPELTSERFDAVLCVNVLEHVRDDELVLSHFAKLLAPGGRLVLLVPAHPWLYSAVDRTLGHFRRYERQGLQRKIERAGLEMESLHGFNRLGALGWLVSGKLLRRRTLSAGQMQAYERLLPVARGMERLSFLPALSLVAIAGKPV
ncbi:MAG: class I SAM-dependent methyltransferase [Planctomycetota bacterium]